MGEGKHGEDKGGKRWRREEASEGKMLMGKEKHGGGYIREIVEKEKELAKERC